MIGRYSKKADHVAVPLLALVIHLIGTHRSHANWNACLADEHHERTFGFRDRLLDDENQAARRNLHADAGFKLIGFLVLPP